MPRRPGTSVFRVNVRGAGREARHFSRAARKLQDEIVAELRRFGAEAELLFRENASEDTGDLRDSIVAVAYFKAIRPRVSIRVEPLRGHEGERRTAFDYLDVSRFGHRRSRIFPTTKRALKVHIMGHRNPHAAIFRSSVRGFGHPSRQEVQAAARRGGREAVLQVRDAAKPVDWVSVAGEQAEKLSTDAAERLGRRIEARVLR